MPYRSCADGGKGGLLLHHCKQKKPRKLDRSNTDPLYP